MADIEFGYGNAEDTPVVGDWDGNGTDTPGVKRGHVWHLRNSNSTGGAHVSFGYGNAGDTPLVRDQTRTRNGNGGGGDEPQRLERGDEGRRSPSSSSAWTSSASGSGPRTASSES